jgi:hypothetical protein
MTSQLRRSKLDTIHWRAYFAAAHPQTRSNARSQFYPSAALATARSGASGKPAPMPDPHRRTGGGQPRCKNNSDAKISSLHNQPSSFEKLDTICSVTNNKKPRKKTDAQT